MPWTKLESANTYSTGEDKVKWALISSTIIHMRATQHFYRGLLLDKARVKKKRSSEKHTEIFLGVFGFLEQANKREKQKQEKLFTRETSQQAKRRTGNLFGFSF